MVRVRSARVAGKLSVRAALLLSSAIGVAAGGQAFAQTVSQTPASGDVAYTNTGTVVGSPTKAVLLTTPDGAINANIGTVTATSTATTTSTSVVSVNNGLTVSPANAKPINLTIGSLTSTGGGEVTGIESYTNGGTATINVTNLNVAGTSGIFANGTGNVVINGGTLKLTAQDEDIENSVISVGRMDGPEDQFGNSENIKLNGNLTINVGSIEARGTSEVQAIAADVTGNISVTAGPIVSDGAGLELDTNDGDVNVTLNGNVTTVDGAVSAGGKNVTITVAAGVTATAQEGVLEAEGGAVVNATIDNKGRVIATTRTSGSDSQGAILVGGTGALTVKSNYAESSDSNLRDSGGFDANYNAVVFDQHGTIEANGTAGPISITANQTLAKGDGMRGINATSTSGSITIVANETETRGNARTVTYTNPTPPFAVTNGLVNAVGIGARSGSGNISITSEKITTSGVSAAGITVDTLSGNAIIDSGTITKTGLGAGINANATAGTVSIESDNLSVTPTGTGNAGIATTGGKGVTIKSGVIAVTNGYGISATSSGQTGSSGVNIDAGTVTSTGTVQNNTNLITGNAVTSGNTVIKVGTVTGTTVSAVTGTGANTNYGASSAIFGRSVAGTVTITADNVRNDSTQNLTVANPNSAGNTLTNNAVGSGISATGRGVTITAGNVEAQGWAIRASTNEGTGTNPAIPLNDGKVVINTTGAVTSRASNAISINGLVDSFEVNVGANSVVTGHATSALAGGARTGSIVVNNLGKIIGAQGSDGAIGVTAGSTTNGYVGGNVTIVSNETSVTSTTGVTGGFISGAIAAVSQGGNGNVSVTSTKATAEGGARYAIYTAADGAGTVTINSGTASSNASQIAGTISATTARGAIKITSGTLTNTGTGTVGIRANSTGGGAIEVTSGSLTNTQAGQGGNGETAEGIWATTAGAIKVNSTTINVAGLGASGIAAVSSGSTVDVTSGTITSTGGSASAIIAQGGGNVNVTSGTITASGAGNGGIGASTSGAGSVNISSQSVSIAGNGTVAVGGQANGTGGVAINSGTVTTAGTSTTGVRGVSQSGPVAITSTTINSQNANNSADAIYGQVVQGGTVTINSGTIIKAGTGNGINGLSGTTGTNGTTQTAAGTVNITSGNITMSSTAASNVGIRGQARDAVNVNSTGTVNVANGFGIAGFSVNGTTINAATTTALSGAIQGSASNGTVTINTSGNTTATGVGSGAIVVSNAKDVVITTAAGTTTSGVGGAIVGGYVESTQINSVSITNNGTATAATATDPSFSTIQAAALGKVTIVSNIATNTGAGNIIAANGGNGVSITAETNTAGPNAITTDLITGSASAGDTLIDVGSVTGNSSASAVRALANIGNVTVIADNVTNSSALPLGNINGFADGTPGSGIVAQGRNVTITAGNVDAQNWAIRATTFATPNEPTAGRAVSITTTGNITSRNFNAISVSSARSLNVTVEANSVVTGHGSSTLAGGANAGDVLITNRGKIVGLQGADGAIGVTATGGGNVTVVSNETVVDTTAAVAGTFASGAIGAVSTGGNGNVSVTSTKASVTGAGRYGIYTSAAGTGTISITSGTLSNASDQAAIRAISDQGAISVASTSLTSFAVGIDAVSQRGNIAVTTGAITAAGNGVMAETAGNSTVIANGAVVSNGGLGIYAAGANASVTVNSGASVRGSVAGISVAGSAAATLTNNGTISGISGPAVAFTGAAAGQLVNSGTITADGGGVAVQFGGGNDTFTQRTGSTVTGTVAFGAGNDTAVLSGTVNTTTATQTVAQYTGAETLAVDTGYWTASAANTGAFGTVRIAQGAALQVNQVGTGLAIQPGAVVNNGRLLMNIGTTFTSDGTSITGTGSLATVGTGTLVIANGSGLTYTGGTFVDTGKIQVTGNFASNVTTTGAGVFQLGNGGTTGTFTGNLVNNGTFIYDRSDSYTLAGNFSGTGNLVKNGAGIVTFGGTYGFTGTTTVNGGSVKFTGQLSPTTELDVRSGTVDLSGVSGGKQTVAELQGAQTGTVALGGSQLVVDQNTNTSFGGAITGTGGIVKDGTGTLDLTGTSTYTGQTRVDEGTLKVNGSIASSTVVVNPGATLGGNGTVGGIQGAGGTLSPGNSIGRMTVNGNIVLTSTSTYTVEANAAGQADRVDATGTAALGGARLQVLAEAGRYNGLTSYTILTAAGGVSGQFGTVTSNFAFLTPTVTYGSNVVTLNLRRNDASFGSFAQGTNQAGVAAAITGLGGGNALFEETLRLQDSRVAASFASLTGELHGGVANGMVENAEALRRNLQTQTGNTDEGTFGWASFTGNWGTANPSTQTARLKTRQSGLLGGIGAAGNGFKSAIGVGSTTASFNSAGHADADSTLVLATAGYTGGPITATIGGTYAWHNIDTRRATSLGAIANSLTDEFKGTTGQIFGEVGFGFTTGAMQVSPFAGLSYVRVHSDAVSEFGGPTALNIAADTREVTFGTAGVRLSANEGWDAGDYTIAPYASAAYRRAWGDRNAALTGQFVGGGAAFGIVGPAIAKDAAEIGIGLELRTGPVRVSAGYNGSISNSWNNHSAQMKVSIGF